MGDVRKGASADGLPRTVRFVLVPMPGFSLLTLAAALEVLRLAAAIRADAPGWTLIGEGGAVVSSEGVTVTPDGDLRDLARGETVLICGGPGIARATGRRMISWLRREARRGLRMGGLGTGVWVLARAGLLEGREAAIDPALADAFAEEFADVTLARAPFVQDGNRLSAGAGAAAAHLMLRLLAQDHGEDLARAVAGRLALPEASGNEARAATRRPGGMPPRLAAVIAAMEARIEEPVSPALLAQQAGLSARQIERLFRRHLGRSPARYYLDLRLERARNLLAQTDLSVINVGLACGFASPSHFSRCYRVAFGTTPFGTRLSRTRADG